MPYYTPIPGVDGPLQSSFLFIHIPKTGGSTLEKYLKQYYCISLFGIKKGLSNVSLQHQTYLSLKKGIADGICDMEKTKIISIVRNPYSRFVSEVFFNRFWGDKARALFESQQTLDEIVERCLVNDLEGLHDNHFLQQHKFLTNEDGTIVTNLTLFKTETLTDSLQEYGFHDYKVQVKPKRKNRTKKRERMLGPKCISLINEVYKKDFELFGYKQL